MLAAGLDGIRRELTVPEATEENLYLLDTQRRGELQILPESLNRALDALEEDEVIQAALGPHVCDRFISAKRLEWQDYRLEVSSWELDKYLSNY
jgi:glutamine synthetase